MPVGHPDDAEVLALAPLVFPPRRQATMLQARRLPPGGSPHNYSSPVHDLGVRKPMLTKRPGVTPVNRRRRSMSADLERAEAYDACEAYPASPSEQQVSLWLPL